MTRLDDALQRAQRSLTAEQAADLIIGFQMDALRSDTRILQDRLLAAKQTRSLDARVRFAAMESAARSVQDLSVALARYRRMQRQRAKLAAGMAKNGFVYAMLSKAKARETFLQDRTRRDARRRAMVLLGRSRLATKGLRKPPTKKNLASFLTAAMRLPVSSSDVGMLLTARNLRKK